MAMRASLTDLGPHGSTTMEFAAKLERYFAMPYNRGRVVPMANIVKYFRLNEQQMPHYKPLIAQSWLRQNQHAPLDAKLHYKAMLERAVGFLDPEMRIVIANKLEKLPRQTYCTKERAVTLLNKVTAPLTEEFVKVYETRQTNALMPASAVDEAVARIRDAYITAPIGDMPDIPSLMAKLKYQDPVTGALLPTAPAGLSESVVRAHQLAEGWREQRGRHVVRAFDIIPEEIKLVAIMRAVETHRMLFNHTKALSHIYTQYYKTGTMAALEQGGKPLKLPPNPTIIASMAETMRRMFDGTGEKISITLNNTATQQEALVDSAKADTQITQATKDYLARMAVMTDSDIQEELGRMETLRSLLLNGGVTGAAADAQVLDVPPSGPAAAREPAQIELDKNRAP